MYTVVFILLIFSESYRAEDDVVVYQLDGQNITYSPFYRIDKFSNKSIGIGYGLLYNKTDYLYYKNANEYSNISTVTKRQKHTFYFYKDTFRNDGKFYIRDDNCKFMCLNPCGHVFMSSTIFTHICKFFIKPVNDSVKIFTKSRATPFTYKSLKYNEKSNELVGELYLNSEDDVTASFSLVGDVESFQTYCKKIGETKQKNLDLSTEERCTTPVIEDTPDYQKKIVVAYEFKNVYDIKVGDNSIFIGSDAKLSAYSDLNTKFYKHTVGVNSVVFKHAKSCKYLCVTGCGQTYMTSDYNEDCTIRLDMSRTSSEFYFRVIKHNKYMYLNNTWLDLRDKPKTYFKLYETNVATIQELCADNPLPKKILPPRMCMTSDATRISFHLIFLILLHYVIKDSD
uniref:PlxyGVORF104 protein n=1 Tax=Plutella xylostella granulovirus TaxID=98383 RepID=A0A1B2CSJ8_9BBAC|nr:PlxyGVORF104 protein [Plutella xylostella granulovirus]